MSKKLGTIVKEARTAKGWTQEALSRKVKGLSAAEVSKLEKGEWEPTQAVLKEIAKALGVTQTSLITAATGATTAAKKTTTAKKASSAKTSSGKTSAAGKTSGKTSSAKKTDTDKLTASEKKLLAAYKKADASTKKAALKLLEGNATAVDLIAALLKGKTDKDTVGSLVGSLGQIFRNGELAPGAAERIMDAAEPEDELKLL